MLNCLLIVLLIFGSSCSTAHRLVKDEDPAKQLIIEHGAHQKEKQEIELVAIAVPQGETIECFMMHFMTLKKMKIPKMREVIVTCIEDFIAKVNADEKIRDRLRNYPITVRDLRFNLGSTNDNGDFYDPPYLGYAYIDEDKINYCYYDNLFGKFSGYDDVIESYDHAQEIVKAAQKEIGQESDNEIQ